MQRKFISIIGRDDILVGVCDDGTVWYHDGAWPIELNGRWIQMHSAPQDPPPETF